MQRHALTAVAVVSLLGSAALAADDAHKDFEKAARRNDTAGMIQAAEKIGEAPTEKGVEVLVKYGALIEDADVYHACRDALSAAKTGEPREELLSLLEKSKRIEQKVLCIDALGGAGDPEAVKAVAAVLLEDDDELKVARMAAIRALSRMEHRDGVQPLFERLAKVGFDSGDAEAEQLYDALHHLTGQAFESLEDWGKWWETAGPDFDPKTKPAAGDSATTRLRQGEGKIFDSVVRSQAFVLCLDISSSMRVIDLPLGETWKDARGKEHDYKDPDPSGVRPPHKESRFVKAQEAFCKFIEGLNPRARFSIVVFGDKKDTRLWKPEVQPATDRVKKDAISFVRKLKWSPATRTDLALELAFSVEGADSIYLFTDGIPESREKGKAKDIPHDEILEKVADLNRARQVKVNCYGMASSKSMRKFLQDLAAQTGGEYRDLRAN